MMEYLYGELSKAVEKVTYEGKESATAAVIVDNENNTIQVNVIDIPVQLISPKVDKADDDGRYILVATLENRSVTYKWSTIENFMSEYDSRYKELVQQDIDETNARISADNAILQQLSTETSAINAKIDAESNRAQAAEQANAKAIEDENARALGIEEELRSSISGEVTRATNKETEIASDLSDEIVRAKTAEGNIDSKIEALDTELSSDIAGLHTELSTRFADLEKEDDRLEGLIAQEAQDRASADTELGNRITSLDNNVVKKTGQTSQTIQGDVAIQGNLSVTGTTTTKDTETLKVQDNMIVTNAGGAELSNLSGLFIQDGSTDGYAIVYDPSKESVILGKGTIDGTGEISVADSERNAIVTRLDTATFTDDNLVKWNGTNNIVEDAGQSLSDIDGKINLKADTTYVDTELLKKQNTLTFDSTPTADSTNPVTSGGIKTALDTKVDKVEGKQLSTEDFTSAEKTKLAGIAENANNYVLPDDVVQDASYVHTDNNYTTDEKNKLSNIEAGAQVNTVTSVNGMTGAVTIPGGDSVIDYNKHRPLYFWEGTESELAEYTVPEDKTPMLHFVEGISLVTDDTIAEGLGITSVQLKQLTELAKLMFIDTSTQPPTIYIDGVWQQTENLQDITTAKLFTLEERTDPQSSETYVEITGLTDYGKALGAIDIPSTYQNKPVEAFTIADSDKLTSLYIPATVTRMVSITYCPNLIKVEVAPENSVYHVGGDCLIGYENVYAGWGSGIIPDDGSVTHINSYAFAGSGVVNVKIPYSVTSMSCIGEFADCKELKSIEIANPHFNNNGVYQAQEAYPKEIFRGCEAIEEMTLPFTSFEATLNLQGPKGFSALFDKRPNTLKTLRITGGTPRVGAFAYFTSLEDVSITGVTKLNRECFDGCSGIKTLFLSEDLTTNENDFRGINIETLAAPAEIVNENKFSLGALKALDLISGSELDGTFSSLEELTLAPTISSTSCSFTTTLKRVNVLDLQAFATMDIMNEFWPLDNEATLYVNGVPVTTNISFPSGTTILKDNVFKNYGEIENLILPSSVTSIGQDALRTPITNLHLPATISEIGYSAFGSIANLYVDNFTPEAWCSINFHGSDSNPFTTSENIYANEVKLNAITIPATVTEIGQYAFSGFKGELIIAEGNLMTKIGDYAFYGYKGSSSITIPATVTEIGQYAFGSCDYAKLIFPEECRIETIGDSPFGGRVQIDNIVIADGVTTLGSLDNSRGLRKITFPDTLLELPSMQYCSSMLSLVIPSSVTTIPSWAFSGSVKLAEVYNLSNVAIDTTQSGFKNIRAVHTSLDEPSIYERDGDFVFVNDNGKYTLWFYEGDSTDVVFPLTHNDEPFVYSLNCVPRPVKITFPTIEPPYFGDPYGNEAFELNDIFDSNTWEFIEEVKILSGKVFGGIDTFVPPVPTSPPYVQPNNIKKVYVPNNICRVDDTFGNLPDACFNEYENGIYIGSEDNPYLVLVDTKSEDVTSLDIHDGCRAIDAYVFFNRELLTHLSIPDSVVYISSSSYLNELNLENAVVYDNATYIGNETNPYTVLMKANDLTITSIDIPETTKVIAPSAFCDMNTGKGCSDLTSLTLPNGLKGMGMYSFGLAGITSLTIPDGVEYIDAGAFAGCPNLQNVVFPNTMKEIYAGMFMACGFETFTVQEGIEAIWTNAFSGSKLVTITLPSTLKNIGIMAFAQCTTLTAINYNGTKEEWSMITKGDGWDDQTGTYVVHCTDGDVAKGEEV